MPQLNQISAEAARQLLLQQQQQAPKFQPADLQTLISFSQILGGLITSSQAAPVQMAEPVHDAEPRMVVREKTGELYSPEPVREVTRADNADQREPKVDQVEGPERRDVSESTAAPDATASETQTTNSEPVVLAREEAEVLAANGGEAQEVSFDATADAPVTLTETDSGMPLFEPEIGPTEDIVAPSVSEPVLEQKQEMVDFLSGRSLGIEQMRDQAPAAPEQTLEKAMPEMVAQQTAKPAAETIPEFRPLVADGQTEQQTEAPRAMTAEPQVRHNLASAKAALLEEVVAEQSNAQARSTAQTNPATLVSQIIARVNVPAAEAAPTPAAATAASGSDGVPGVRATQAAEGAPTLRNEAVRVNQAEIIERIVRLTKSGVNRGRQEVRLVLNPPELGGMKIHIKIEHGTLDATIRTDTVQAHQLVSANLAELKSGLIEAGLDVGFLEVLLTGEEAGSGRHSSFEEHLADRGGRTDGNAARARSLEMEPALAPGSVPTLTGMSLIDITV